MTGEDSMKNAFYPMVFRQKHIIRWGLMRNIDKESLSEHSYNVAVLAHALCLIGNRYFNKNLNADRAASLALFHDVTEVYTGDMPTPAKYYNEDMRRNYKVIEENAVSQLLSKLPEDLVPDYEPLLREADKELYPYVKAADKLDAYIKCIDECKCNNAEFKSAAKTTYNALLSYKLPELEYFMEHFLPAFSEDLDTLQK